MGSSLSVSQLRRSRLRCGFSAGPHSTDASPAAVTAYLASLPHVELVPGDATDAASVSALLDGCSACLALHGATRRRKLLDLLQPWKNPADTDPSHARSVNYEAVKHILAAARRASTTALASSIELRRFACCDASSKGTELATDAEMIRALIWKTAWEMDQGVDHLEITDKVAMCNYRGNRFCCDAADQAMQACGGYGYGRKYPFEHIYRHHRRYRITEGTEEIQIRKVAGKLFGFAGRAKTG